MPCAIDVGLSARCLNYDLYDNYEYYDYSLVYQNTNKQQHK